MLSICSLQGLCGIATPWEPLAHARLVLTPVDAKDCRYSEKNNLGFLPLRRVHWQWYFFCWYCTFFNHQLFPDCPNISTAKHKWYCCHTTSFWLKLFVVTVGDTTSILDFFSSLNQKFCNSCGEKLSAFFEVLADQGWRSNMSRQRTAPKHLFDLHRRATAQVLLLAHASPEVLQNPVSKGLLTLLIFCLKTGRTGNDKCHGALDSNDVHFQPFTRFPFLLDFAGIFLPVKPMFTCSKVRRYKLHPFGKISADVFSLLYFKMSPQSQL